jgi:ribosomal protein L11 methylase PrmA
MEASVDPSHPEVFLPEISSHGQHRQGRLIVSVVHSSFRDPSGFVYSRPDGLYRQVNQVYRESYDRLMGSGLYAALVEAKLLVAHEEVDVSHARSPDAYKVLRPEPVAFVSYPYEWCFSQLQDAALATLTIQRTALDFGMSLRDASAYNIQLHRGRPVLIDTLSFERLRDGAPWVAYRQFCQHFLAPLALMAYRDVRLSQLARVHIDGVPVGLAASLLPGRARLRVPLLLHLFLHARSERRHAYRAKRAPPTRPFTLRAFHGLIDSLATGVAKLRWEPGRSMWSGYYAEAESYAPDSLQHKKELMIEFLDEANPRTVWDLGGNIGLFSRIASGRGITTICFDNDPACVEANFRQVREEEDTALLPLVLDLTNPSPRIGWENQERLSVLDRGPADMAFALALIHHLAIGNNVPLDRIANFLRQACTWLAVEFVPKADPMVRLLLGNREDIFPYYTEDGFERAFGPKFAIVRHEQIKGSERVLYLMRAR